MKKFMLAALAAGSLATTAIQANNPTDEWRYYFNKASLATLFLHQASNICAASSWKDLINPQDLSRLAYLTARVYMEKRDKLDAEALAERKAEDGLKGAWYFTLDELIGWAKQEKDYKDADGIYHRNQYIKIKSHGRLGDIVTGIDTVGSAIAWLTLHNSLKDAKYLDWLLAKPADA